MRTVLRNAVWPGDIAVEESSIRLVGTVEPEQHDAVVDCADGIITPGMICTHHHMWQRLTRGRATSSDLFGWLTHLYPRWANVTAQDVKLAATVALAEMALGGATTVADQHYLVPSEATEVFDAIVEAQREVGIRLHLVRGAMDMGESAGGLPPDNLVETIDRALDSTADLVRRVHDGDLVSVAVGPNSLFTTSMAMLEQLTGLGRALGLRTHLHLAEAVDEVEQCQARYGRRPLELLMDKGLLANDMWFAHGIYFNEAEVAELGAAGVGVAHCPSSNARLGTAACPVRPLIDAGVHVGLGVDGSASNESGSMLAEVTQALYVARTREQSAEAMTPADALELATRGGASCLGRSDLGRLESGYGGDLVVWDAADLLDCPDPIAGLVLGPRRQARHVMVGGRWIVREGVVQGVDLPDLQRRLAARSAEIL